MEKFYKISESELITLLTDSLRLTALDEGGVGNWTWYGDNFDEFLQGAMRDEGLNLEEEDKDFGFRDLAQLYLKDYQEI